MDIQTYLKKNNLTMAMFGELVGVQQSAISLITNKKRRPSPDLALRIEQATKGQVDRMELLYPTTNTDPGD